MTTLTAPPVSIGDWDFGDFPYAVEPLTLPPAGSARVVDDRRYDRMPDCEPDRVCAELQLLAGGPRAAAQLTIPPAPSAEQLFWFRWIVGHQVTFALWRLMGTLLARHGRRDVLPPGEVLARLESYTHGYGAMLLYSGSCPRSLYSTLLRPAMFLQHRGFSGTWAPDFVNVRSLLRGRSLSWLADPRAAGVAAAVETQRAIHDDVATRLVPNGRSLLRESMSQAPVHPSDRTAVLYDNFFMTLRAPVNDTAVAVQLLQRLRAVALDLAVNGLYPLGRDEPVDDADEWGGPVATCQRRLGPILVAAAGYATEVAKQE